MKHVSSWFLFETLLEAGDTATDPQNSTTTQTPPPSPQSLELGKNAVSLTWTISEQKQL